MKYLIILLMLPLLSASDCTPKKTLPSCLEKMLNDRVKNEPQDAPINVSEYEYQGKRVFMFAMPCCDRYNDLYDADCNRICAPTGGITGKGDGKCPDFKDSAKEVGVVWTNPSKK